MKGVEVVAEVLKREGVEHLICYPRCSIIEAAAALGIRPIVVRQERVGVGIADGFSRVNNGRKIGVFAMQRGPGAENAYSGIATAFSDSTPLLLLPSGYTRAEASWPRFFTAAPHFASITKWSEQTNTVEQVADAMRRAFSRLRMGRLGPVVVEVPDDVAEEDVPEPIEYTPPRPARSMGNARDIDEVAGVLLEARAPIIHAGQGVLWAEATAELVQVAELLQAPVLTSLAGKSAFPEGHPLALGTTLGARASIGAHFLNKADVVLGVGCSFTRHGIANTTIPPGKKMVHITNDEADINKNYSIDHPIVGDAKLVLQQLVEALTERMKGKQPPDTTVVNEIASVTDAFLEQWKPRLTSNATPISPYRVIWELQKTIPASEAIVTHDSGGPRGQMVPFYDAAGPRSYLGWGKSHGLGTGLGLAIGAKLAAPEKVAINWMGDAAFGMVGLDFETAVRCEIPIITLLSNNFSMQAEVGVMPISRERYRSTDIGGNYADLAKSLGGYGERIEDPEQIRPALQRARKVTETEGRPALLEFITGSPGD